MKRIDDYLNVSSIALLAVGLALLTAIFTIKNMSQEFHEPKDETLNYQHDLNQILPKKGSEYLKQYPASLLPDNAAIGEVVLVTDGASDHDCYHGNGLSHVRCTWDGTVWYPEEP